ncbi:MAG TPA: glycosyltransferase family 4 protein [Nitrospiraceae bacterium]|nr:glycosyltransferase family 4 protein [Nitrospiraceae bacterium]
MRLLLFNLANDADDPALGFTTRWVGALAKRVEFIHVITMRAGRAEIPGNVRVCSMGREKGYSKLRRVILFYLHLHRILRDDHIDVCFSHMTAMLTMLAAPVLKTHRIPIVTWYAHPTLTWPVKVAHHVSDRMVASLATAYPYTHEKLTVVGQGIDLDLFNPDGISAPVDPPIILCVGRLSPVKNHLTLLEAAALLQRERGKRFRIVILGDPASPRDERYADSLRERVRDLALDDTVRLAPSVPLVKLPHWYRRCTVHVNLTPTGSGDKVVWEAMACGRPCIVANEGFRESLGEYAGHLLFRYGNAEHLAERLKWILSLENRERATIGACLREYVGRIHSLDGLAGRLTRVFAECRRLQ